MSVYTVAAANVSITANMVIALPLKSLKVDNFSLVVENKIITTSCPPFYHNNY